jgi:transposase
MTQYSDEFKEHIIQQMLPPISKSVRQLHNENGVSEQTLFKWKKQAKALGMAAPSGTGTSEEWSSEDKFLIVLETARMNQAELAEYGREKGLYVEQIEAWRDACINANGSVANESKRLKKDLSESKKTGDKTQSRTKAKGSRIS